MNVCVLGVFRLIFIVVGLIFCDFNLVFPSIHVKSSPNLETPEERINKRKHIHGRESTQRPKERKNVDGADGHRAEKLYVEVFSITDF